MKIKRYTAPDMRTAMRQVREDQGPDAVILSSKRIDDVVEIVAQTAPAAATEMLQNASCSS